MNLDHSELEFSTYDPVAGMMENTRKKSKFTEAQIAFVLKQAEDGTAIHKCRPWLKHLFGDGAYARTRLLDACPCRDFVLEIVRRCDRESGFKVLPRRWVVERTFGWMTKWRRLVRDYQQRQDVFEAMAHIAMGSLLLRCVTHPWQFSNGLLNNMGLPPFL